MIFELLPQCGDFRVERGLFSSALDEGGLEVSDLLKIFGLHFGVVCLEVVELVLQFGLGFGGGGGIGLSLVEQTLQDERSVSLVRLHSSIKFFNKSDRLSSEKLKTVWK